MTATELARARFPAGLVQPPGSYRFGLDALLLGAFALRVAAEKRWASDSLRLVEIGCGCGASLLACALRLPAKCLGVDREEKLVSAARRNALLLGLENVHFEQADLNAKGFFRQFGDWAGKCQIALANPPWLRPGAGAQPITSLRRGALCAQPGTLAVFCRRASGFLKSRGSLCCILPPRLLCDFIPCAASADLGVRLILPVHTKRGEAASRLLLLCRKNMKPEPVFQPPLCAPMADSRGKDAKEFSWMPWPAAAGIHTHANGPDNEFCS